MIRTFVVFAIFASLAAVSAPAFADTGVAYDQVTIMTQARPFPKVTDFGTVWTAELAAQKLAPSAPGGKLPLVQVASFAWLGDRERVESPIDGSVIIIRPRDREIISIDVAKRTYSIAKSDGDIYPVTTSSALAPPAGAPHVQALLRATSDALPDALVDGIAYKGFAGKISQTVDDSRCSYKQATAFFTVFADSNRRDPQAGTDLYAEWLAGVAPVLSHVSGCNVSAPVNVVSAVPVYPSFLLYSLSVPVISNQDMAFGQAPSGIANIQMRGHVRTLTDADASLFEPPSGFKQVP